MLDVSRLRALVFDMDGVFVDTEPIVFDVFRQVFEPMHISLTDEYMYRFVGHPTRNNLKNIQDDFGVTLDEPAIMQQLKTAYDTLMPQRVAEAQAGVWELVQAAKSAQWPLALCTTSYRNDVEVIFGALLRDSEVTLASLFDTIVSGDQVTHKKPHPEPYQTACKRLGVTPAETLVIEDTAVGVEAAKSAGCQCAALQQPYNRHLDFGAADVVISSLHELREKLDL